MQDRAAGKKDGFFKKWAKRLWHQLELLYRIIKDRRLRRRTHYAYCCKYLPVRKKTILYEAFFGRGMLDNPYALFLALTDDPARRHYTHVWVLDDMRKAGALKRRYPGVKLRFVELYGKKYDRCLATAQYLINNVTFPSWFMKRKDQVYINTWHGIPLKTLGYDMPDGVFEATNVVRNFLQADHLISASTFLTEIYQKAYKMDQILPGKIIEKGYPRLDTLVRFPREEVLEGLRREGVCVDEKRKIILYAPTWKGSSYQNADAGVEIYYRFYEELERRIDTTRYQLLIKVHQRVFELAGDRLNGGYFVPATVDANELLSVTDILISDFSSIFYDYLALRRPILFYIPDLAGYAEERGIYRPIDELPGPCTDSVTELAEWIGQIGEVEARYRAKLETEAAWAGAETDGRISERVLRVILNGETDEQVKGADRTKERLFISRGRMAVNGVSTSFLNLLKHIDYERFDVTVMVSTAKSENERALIREIPAQVRVLYRDSTLNMTWLEQVRHNFYSKYGGIDPSKAMYARERRRVYGDASFDRLIDFEGYGMFYAALLIAMGDAPKYIWLHNDMEGERKQKYAWLPNIFRLYRYFDALVSCSREIMEVNRENLGGLYAPEEKFRYAKNMIDTEGVRRGAEAPCVCVLDGEEYLKLEEVRTNGSLGLRMIKKPQRRTESGERTCHFINVGRLSTEKNQESLLRAFARLAGEVPGAMLYLVGDGPLKKQLQSLLRELRIEERVVMTGSIRNPFAVMRYCDCFLLPSLYEGQPMVVHEARMLHKPIILSDFSSVKGVMLEKGQYMTGTGEEDIYQGMRAFIDGKVPADYTFDADAYNAQAYREFLEAVGC